MKRIVKAALAIMLVGMALFACGRAAGGQLYGSYYNGKLHTLRDSLGKLDDIDDIAFNVRYPRWLFGNGNIWDWGWHWGWRSPIDEYISDRVEDAVSDKVERALDKTIGRAESALDKTVGKAESMLDDIFDDWDDDDYYDSLDDVWNELDEWIEDGKVKCLYEMNSDECASIHELDFNLANSDYKIIPGATFAIYIDSDSYHEYCYKYEESDMVSMDAHIRYHSISDSRWTLDKGISLYTDPDYKFIITVPEYKYFQRVWISAKDCEVDIGLKLASDELNITLNNSSEINAMLLETKDGDFRAENGSELSAVLSGREDKYTYKCKVLSGGELALNNRNLLTDDSGNNHSTSIGSGENKLDIKVSESVIDLYTEMPAKNT